MPGLPYAIGCPSCDHHVRVSTVDPDSSLSDLAEHIFWTHAPHNHTLTEQLLAKVRDLTAEQVSA
jgi:hypothetical protein